MAAHVWQVRPGHRKCEVAGRLRAACLPEPGTLVIVALRPEALRMRTTPKGPNNIDGFVEYSTSLGETAQHALRASDGSILRLSELNPSGRSPADYRSWYHAIAHPADVVILQAPEGMVESL